MKQIEKNLGYLGVNFQQSLIKAIIEEKKYGEAILQILETKYFDNASFRYIVENIKELHSKYNKIPSYETITQKIVSESGSFDSTIHSDTLLRIKESIDDLTFVKDTALNFCRQQNLMKVLKNEVMPILDNGKFEEYDRISNLVDKAQQAGNIENEEVDIFDEIDEALEDDFRHPIPTGIVGIDNALSGGLGKKELGIVLAGTGVGKSTVLTKIANTGYNHGNNVLHIFFEDTKVAIERKHITVWTGVPSQEMSKVKDQIKQEIIKVKNMSKGSLHMIKYPSEGVTVNTIRSKVRRMISEGINLDLVVIDYVDCINGTKTANGDEWKGEASIMRAIETMCEEFNIATWVGTQGSRCVKLDTKITLENQGETIIKYVKVGDKILTHDGYKLVSNVFPIEKQPTYKITLKSGKTIEVSKRHKFPTSENVFKSLEDGLSIGDILLTQK